MLLGLVCWLVFVELSWFIGLIMCVVVNEQGYLVFVEWVDGLGVVCFYVLFGVRELLYSFLVGKVIFVTMFEDEVCVVVVGIGLSCWIWWMIMIVEEFFDDLQVIRCRGFAVDDEEDVAGVFCIGALFYDHRGRCAGALSATGIKLDLSTRRIEELGGAVEDAAAAVTRALGGHPPAAAG